MNIHRLISKVKKKYRSTETIQELRCVTDSERHDMNEWNILSHGVQWPLLQLVYEACRILGVWFDIAQVALPAARGSTVM